MKKMRHMKRKALVALVLSVTMLLTLMPGLVFGVSDDQGDPDTVSSSIDYPTVNFTDVAPFLPPVSGAAPRRSPARAAGDKMCIRDRPNIAPGIDPMPPNTAAVKALMPGMAPVVGRM